MNARSLQKTGGFHMFQKLGDALRRFMYGRYGADSLNKALLLFAVILILLGGIGSRYLAPWMAAFNTLAYVPLIGRTATSPVRAAVRSSACRAARAGSISAARSAASSLSKRHKNYRRRHSQAPAVFVWCCLRRIRRSGEAPSRLSAVCSSGRNKGSGRTR